MRATEARSKSTGRRCSAIQPYAVTEKGSRIAPMMERGRRYSGFPFAPSGPRSLTYILSSVKLQTRTLQKDPTPERSLATAMRNIWGHLLNEMNVVPIMASLKSYFSIKIIGNETLTT